MLAFALTAASAQAAPPADKKSSADAKPQANSSADPGAPSDSSTAIWPHSETSRFWISGQQNIILQGHPRFSAKYTGENSLKPQKEERTSFLSTLYLGYQATQNTE